MHRQLVWELSSPEREALVRALCSMGRFARPAADAYERNGFRLMTSRAGTLGADARAAAELLMDVGSHGIDPAAYPLAELGAALRRYDDARAPFLGPELRPASAVSRLRAALFDVEVALVTGFLQYALHFRFLDVAHPHETRLPEEVAAAPAVFEDSLVDLLLQARGRLSATMRGLWPIHPHYEKARAALRLYRELAERGPTPPWTARRALSPGMRGPDVAELERRLAAESFYRGDLDDDLYGPDLEKAVAAFQEHNHIEPTGRIPAGSRWTPSPTSRALETTIEDRVEALKLSLQRWRESDARESYFVHVNIPEYTARVFENGRVLREHKVIVGLPGVALDERTGHNIGINRTPLLSSAIDRIVLNPIWYVPVRIQKGELDAKAAADPTYLERNGFRVRTVKGGKTRLLQVPGRGNALGRLKILFPNPHFVYLHDTPGRAGFHRLHRALSHGCVRVHEPVELAALILERDGAMGRPELDRALGGDPAREVVLERPVPIHIEYNTVTFRPESDLPVFLRDVYGYDDAYRRGALPYSHEQRTVARRRAARVPPSGAPAICQRADAGEL